MSSSVSKLAAISELAIFLTSGGPNHLHFYQRNWWQTTEGELCLSITGWISA